MPKGIFQYARPEVACVNQWAPGRDCRQTRLQGHAIDALIDVGLTAQSALTSHAVPECRCHASRLDMLSVYQPTEMWKRQL